MVTVLADHGSFTISLLFGGPVAVLLLALLALTWHERRQTKRPS